MTSVLETRQLPLPTFLIIGAQKSATRWLRVNLGVHPDVFAARRELEFFNNAASYRQGADFYRAEFEGWEGERFVGEATPGYMFWRHRTELMAQRVQETVPDVRVLAILRNPVDRALSALLHHIEFKEFPPDADLLEVVRRTPPEKDRLGIVSGGWYAASLEPYAEIFGEQLLVLLHDDSDDDPRGTYDRALRHVGASPDFLPPELEQVLFSNQEEPSPGAPVRRELTLDARRALYEYFAADIEKLAKLMNRDLSLWDPERASV